MYCCQLLEVCKQPADVCTWTFSLLNSECRNFSWNKRFCLWLEVPLVSACGLVFVPQCAKFRSHFLVQLILHEFAHTFETYEIWKKSPDSCLCFEATKCIKAEGVSCWIWHFQFRIWETVLLRKRSEPPNTAAEMKTCRTQACRANYGRGQLNVNYTKACRSAVRRWTWT